MRKGMGRDAPHPQAELVRLTVLLAPQRSGVLRASCEGLASLKAVEESRN
jgi:hypothetical protein